MDCISTLGSKQLLIGGPNPITGLYDAALANGVTPAGHQPYILASGGTYSSGPLSGPTFTGLKSSPEWVLNVPQLTATSAVTGVPFGFGTAYAAALNLYQPAKTLALRSRTGSRLNGIHGMLSDRSFRFPQAETLVAGKSTCVARR